MIVIALHIVLAIAACAGLWRLWRLATAKADPRAALIVSAGFLIRAFAGAALFWISWLGLPIARSLQLGEGFWYFAVDSPGYMTYAKHLVQGHPDPSYPSRAFVQILALGIAAFGRFASVAVLLNCATYLGTCALILYLGRGARTATLVALAAVAFTPGVILWSLQPLKDPLFFFAFTAMVAACRLWREATATQQRIAAAAAMLVLIYVLAGMRWYFAILWWGCWLIFALAVAVSAPRKIGLLLGTALLFVLLGFSIREGAKYDVPELPMLRRFAPMARLEYARKGFESVPGATTITPGHTVAPQPKPQPVPQPTPQPAPTPRPTPRPTPAPVLKPQPQPAPATPPPQPQPRPRKRELPPAPPLRQLPFDHVIATAAVTFLPRTLVELLGIAHVGTGRGQWVIVEIDTLAFDAVILFAVLYVVRARRRLTALTVALILMFCLTTIPIVYVLNNFGTLFRLRQMLYMIAVLVPLTSAPRRP